MSEPLLDRLAAHRTLASVPRPQLEWLAAAAVARTLHVGDVLTPGGGPVKGLYVVLSGHLSIRVDRGAGPRIVMEWHGGDVTGLLPYSRIKGPPANVVAEEPSDILALDASELPRLIQECPQLTAVLVHVMIDRARVFKSSELLDEKVASLGRLAAGLAHELNNPASAVARSAKTLVSGLSTLDAATARFTALDLTGAQASAVAALRDEMLTAASTSPLDLADRQDAIDDWFDAHDVDDVDSEPLARSGLQAADLDALLAAVGEGRVGIVLAHESAQRAVRQLAMEIETAATRIHTLVAAVKGFTYVNQQATLMPIAIGQGLSDTITVLRSKARTKSVEVELRVPEQLPAVEGYGGELNQVWANLVDNAIDATPGGHVRVEAESAGAAVVVRVIDDGPGIPADVAGRIFDPFFTTKDVGEGTGLGLDIARRIVQRHHGAIDMNTSERGTEFRVTLPAVIAAGTGV
ncbi:MAG TPA: ATP-binding protein [Vicinamibacterales bacterium]|nr:ATP-binding protein [Vicinamibacterales bacterium]